MSYPCNVDKVAEYVKSIVEANRCPFCDKLDGSRWRFSCGHVACVECVDACCRLCPTPPTTAEAQPPALDEPLTKRAVGAVTLLQTCQKTFNIDVYKRLRISEQNKAERELFPSCIQAPAKYYNKRKSYGLLKDKENISVLPREVPTAMDKNNYVQRWLEQSERSILSPRKAFADLNVNQTELPHRTPIKRRVDIIMNNVSRDTENIPVKKKRHSSNKQTLLNKHVKIMRNKKNDSIEIKKNNALSVKDESGIVVDETIVIDDSQSQGHVDKDHQAWLAVQRAADKDSDHTEDMVKEICIEPSLPPETSLPAVNLNVANTNTPPNKIPFYKKTILKRPYESCVDGTDTAINTEDDVKPTSRDVSITIESDTFVTMIKVTNVPEKGTKQSVGVQTDLKTIVDKEQGTQDVQTVTKVVESQDIFGDIMERQNGSLFIQASDSDSEESLDLSHQIEVAAQVHRPSDQLDINVLGELENSETQRRRRGPRGITPNSTDSSEKENYDPNHLKRNKYSKKYKKTNKPSGFLCK